jgi:hypothetical protein
MINFLTLAQTIYLESNENEKSKLVPSVCIVYYALKSLD